MTDTEGAVTLISRKPNLFQHNTGYASTDPNPRPAPGPSGWYNP
jgi:hypothetical protein